jgi:hypothetical protein
LPVHLFCGNSKTMLMSNRNQAAKLHYMPSSFRMLSGGDHVICAVSGARIELEELRYWSVARQEPYATAEISTQSFTQAAKQSMRPKT